MKNIKTKTIELTPYPLALTFVIARFKTDAHKYQNYLNKKHGLATREEQSWCGHCHAVYDKKQIWVIVSDETGAGILTHELFHATTIVADYVGGKINIDCDEPFAYLIGRMATEFVKFNNTIRWEKPKKGKKKPR